MVWYVFLKDSLFFPLKNTRRYLLVVFLKKDSEKLRQGPYFCCTHQPVLLPNLMLISKKATIGHISLLRQEECWWSHVCQRKGREIQQNTRISADDQILGRRLSSFLYAISAFSWVYISVNLWEGSPKGERTGRTQSFWAVFLFVFKGNLKVWDLYQAFGQHHTFSSLVFQPTNILCLLWTIWLGVHDQGRHSPPHELRCRWHLALCLNIEKCLLLRRYWRAKDLRVVAMRAQRLTVGTGCLLMLWSRLMEERTVMDCVGYRIQTSL